MNQPSPSPSPSGPLEETQPIGPPLDQEAMADLPGWAPVTAVPGPASPDQPPAGEQDEPQPARGRDSRSTTGSASRLSAKSLGDAVGAGFTGAGKIFNQLAREDAKDQVWLATDEEVEGVGEPAGRLIARRVPDLPGGTDAGDLADLIALMIPLATYAVRNLADWLPRRKRRKTVPGQVIAPATEGA